MRSNIENDFAEADKSAAAVASPLLTIAIPTMNRPRALKRTLEDLAEQVSTREEIVEILVAHNGDNTNASHLDVPPNCILKEVFHEKNIGLSGNVGFLALNATGQFFWLLADDDLICPGSVGNLLDQLRGIDGDFHAGVRWTLDSGSEAFGLDKFERRSSSADEFMASYWEKPVFISCIVLRTSSAREFAALPTFRQRGTHTYPQTALFYQILAVSGQAWILKGFAVEDSRPSKLYSQASAFRVRIEDLIGLYVRARELFAHYAPQVSLGAMRSSVLRKVVSSSIWDLLVFTTRRQRLFSVGAFWRLIWKRNLGPNFGLALILIYGLNLLSIIHPGIAQQISCGALAVAGKKVTVAALRQEAEVYRAELGKTGLRHFDYHPEHNSP